MPARQFTRVAALCATLAFLLLTPGCGEDNPVSENGNNHQPPPPPSPPGSVLLTIRIASWDDLTGQGAVERTPTDVAEIRFEVSAPGITTQTRLVPPTIPPIEETFTVKTGTARQLKVDAFDAAGTPLFTTRKYVSTVDSVLTSAVSMVSVSDDTPPVYAGLADAVTISDSHVLLSWLPADDAASAASELSYLVFISTQSGVFDYASPSHVTRSGETSLFIADLDPGATYYFVVRAMDRAGNVDTNAAQQTVSMAPASGALYVDVGKGTDTPACGTAGSPCKTITYGLAKSASNQTIHVAQGTYNAANGESFPLVLKPGTALSGDGYWWDGIKVIKTTIIEGTTPIILGADGAEVISCYLKPTAFGTSLRTIDDDGHPIFVFHCTVDGSEFPGGQGVSFSAASSLVDCEVEGFSAGGGRAVGVWGAGGASIRGSFVRNCTTGIALAASNSSVSHCIVEDIGSTGIGAGTTSLVTGNVAITLNAVSRTVGNGVAVTNCSDVAIIGNAVSFAGGYGISVNSQQPADSVTILNNSISKGSSAAIWLTSGAAAVNGNTIVCNVAGVHLSTGEVIDLRWNAWDHDPPTISPGRGPTDPGCDGFYDICYERDYAGTPEPLYQPDSGTASCVVGVVPLLARDPRR